MSRRGWGTDHQCFLGECRLKGQFGQTNYNRRRKPGCTGFSKALGAEVVRKGVTVNTISPGYVRDPTW